MEVVLLGHAVQLVRTDTMKQDGIVVSMCVYVSM